ncbi:MAG TPA: glycoside hydrolase family 3 N-terminal domain-containing protein, partial [Rhodothermales bacterium]
MTSISAFWRRPRLLGAILLAFAVFATACAGPRESAVAPSGAVVSGNAQSDAFIEDLISQMTLEEKLGQISQYSWGAATGPMAQDANPQSLPDRYRQYAREGRVGSFFNVVGAEETRELQRLAVEESRLGIPLIFGYDVIHGFRTEFPIPIAEAATWNPEAVERAARIAGIEAAAHGLHWTFAPMVDIARDPRWGRLIEGSGEDPYLGSVMAAARVRGFQGTDLSDPLTVLACVKHFAAYGAAEAGRDYNTVDMSERTLRDIYLPPYHAAVDAGAGSVMTSFNEIGGVVSSVSPFLLDQVLRDEWGFDGMVVSDWTSIMESHVHGIGESQVDVGELALEAGLDMDMMSDIYSQLGPRVESGEIPMEVLDRAVRNILRAKQKLGLFEDPYRYSDPARQAQYTLAADHIAHAREVARQAIVLLKNDGNVLPLSKDLGTLAVVGALANDDDAPLGPWSAQGRREDVVNILEGITAAVGSGMRIIHSPGVDIRNADTTGIAAAVAAAQQADAVVLVLGEPRNMTGEAASRAIIDLPGAQQELAEAVLATGKPVVVV